MIKIEQDLERILTLRTEVIDHDLRFSKDKPIISDTEYDMLYMELVDLESKYPEAVTKDSPTQKIYTTVVDGLVEVKHTSPMLSQDKAYTIVEIENFMNRSDSDIIEEEKMDGLSLILKYNNHILIDALTRGNGEVGYRCLHIAKTMSNVPKKIAFGGMLDVRSEGYISLKDFERINSLLPDEDKYANPRNLASGTMKQLDAGIAKERNIQAKAFDIIQMENEESFGFKSDIKRKTFLKEQGFDVVDYNIFKNNEEGRKELFDYCTRYNKEIRPNLEHMVDGLVLKFVDLKVREQLGETSKYPRWAIAFKFDSPEATTVIKKITNQTGKSGKITPVAEFAPTYLDGSTITYATLHNDDFIKDKDIRIGDRVVITKGGEVIPKVLRVILSERPFDSAPTPRITHCATCGEVASKHLKADKTLTVDSFCDNDDCEAQFIGKFKNFISRDAMKIDGLGEKTIEMMINKDIVTNFPDIYQLADKQHIFDGIEGFGDKSFNKMIAGIEASKSRSLSQLLLGLSISKIGKSTSKRLAKEFLTMDALIEATENYQEFISRVSAIEDTGEVVAKSLYNFIRNDERMDMLLKLKELGLTMAEEIIEITQNAITGKNFVVTGKVNHYSNRKALQAEIEGFGGKVSGSVSSKTDYLINNDKTSISGKNKDALKNGIPIISEEDYMNMI